MLRKIILLSCFVMMVAPVLAQSSIQWSASEIKLQLKKLNVLGSVLYIAAHPDDENTRLLSYLAKERLVRTGYLSLTRGDGGQNLIGSEQAEELGLIRTQELLAARRVDGAEQFFSRANDFGYSKNPQETFKIWDKNHLLADVVWAIRKFRPDVIICRFPTTGEGGHGHHTASAILAQEAFALAADPASFPEQLKYVETWQAKRLLWNTFSFGTTNTTAPDQLKIDVGVYNPLLGKGYGEIAAESRSNHKSQGFGSAKGRGTTIEYFKPILGDSPIVDLLDGVTTSWTRIGASGIDKQIQDILQQYNPENPAAILPLLKELWVSVSAVKDNYWREQKQKELQQIILACAGLWAEVYTSDNYISPGQKLDLKLQAICRSKANMAVGSISVLGQDSLLNMALPFNELKTITTYRQLDTNAQYSQPYWLVEPHAQGEFVVNNQLKIGKAENDEAVQVAVSLKMDNQDLFTIKRPLSYKYTDPVKGEVYKPVEIVPPVTASFTEKVYVFTNAQPKMVKLQVKAFTAHADGNVRLKLPAGWVSEPVQQTYQLINKGDELVMQFLVKPAQGAINQSVKMGAVLVQDKKTYQQGLKQISYDHIPNITYCFPSEAKLVSMDNHSHTKKVGYVSGAGDLIPAMLTQMGYDVKLLSETDLKTGNLNQYDAIVTGVRAYNTEKMLKQAQPNLMSYVEKGGNMVVMYNTNQGLVTDQLGPYPFKLSRDRVTDEQAAVSFTDANHPLLNKPNKITAADFQHWIQERGLYFCTDVDSKYTKLFKMNDEGEQPLDGALLVAQYGKGQYIYTGLSFFRELPAGVVGAYRLMNNLLEKPVSTKTSK